MTCTAPAVNGQFTLRVYTRLNSAANDESFGIDNVVLKKYAAPPPFKTLTANFQNEKDFQGFNCVKITTCGTFGKICGGYNTKAKSHDIKKTYKNLPDGTYEVSLDFIKIDSWCESFALGVWIALVPCVCVHSAWSGGIHVCAMRSRGGACVLISVVEFHTAGTTSTRMCK